MWLALAAPVAALAVVAAGCGGGSTTATSASGAEGGGGGGGPTGAIALNGSGSTFQQPIVVKWSGEYHAANSQVQVNYQPIGSGGGIEQFTSGVTDFGGTDAPMNDDELAAAKQKGGDVLHIPIVLGGVVVTYNLPGVNELKLDGPTLAGIYLGTITKWNDPKIAALNAGVTLPATDIKVVHRSDSSGTSYVFSGYLSAVSPEWASKVGQDKAPNWPVGIGGQGNDGVAAAVKQTAGGIGYNELAFAEQNNIPFALLKNAEGEFVKCSADSLTAAAQGFEYPADLRFSLLNSKSPGAYPITSATWQIVWKDPAKVGINRAKAQALVNWITWEVSNGQKDAASLGYAPISSDLQSAAVKLLDTMVIPSS